MAEDATTGAGPGATEAELLGAGDRVAELLEEVRAACGPSAWGKVEELVRTLLALYGAGLERVLRHAAAVERADGALAARLEGDALVASLLLLHGLHPDPTEARVGRALEDARGRLGLASAELAGIDGDGVVRVRVAADPRSCPSAGPAVASAIERTIVEAAPEVTRVEVEGVAAPAARAGGGLVQLGTRRAGAR